MPVYRQWPDLRGRFTCTQQRNGKSKTCKLTGYKTHDPTGFHCPETLKSSAPSGDYTFASKGLGPGRFSCLYNRKATVVDDGQEICTYDSKGGKYIGNAERRPCPAQLGYMCPKTRKLKHYSVKEQYSSQNEYHDQDYLACWYKSPAGSYNDVPCNYYKANGKFKRGGDGCPSTLVP